MVTTTNTAPRLNLYELGQNKPADGWLVSDWAAGQTSIMRWSDDNVRVSADGYVELVLDRAHNGSSRPWEGGEIQNTTATRTGTWSWTAQAPEMAPGAVFGMFTYKSDWKKAPWTEFDFEFVGNDTTRVELNIHMINASGKHVTLAQNKANKTIIDLGFDASKGVHTYEVSVTETGATFYIDGKTVGDFTGADMPGGTWNLAAMNSYVDLWAAPNSMAGWTGKWTDPGRPLIAKVLDAEIRPGEYGSNYSAESELEADLPVNLDAESTPDEDEDAMLPVAPEPEPVVAPTPLPSPAEDALPADAPKGSIIGDYKNDFLNGGSRNDTIFGFGGNDTIVGKTGADAMYGMTGNDTYWVDNASDRTIERADEGYDWTHTTVNWTLADNVEAMSLRTAANINGNGNALDNFITGNSGANIIAGMAGDDIIEGRGGNDVLIGGSGSDKLVGGLGSDIFRFAAGDGQDTIADFTAGGGDVIDVQGYAGFLELRAESGGIRVVLSSSDSILLNDVVVSDLSTENFLFDGMAPKDMIPLPSVVTPPPDSIVGTASNNTLKGGGSNDRIYGLGGNDLLDGKGGADEMYGGNGNDVFWVNHASDRTIEQADEGYDWTHTTVNWTLADNVEAMSLRTAANINGNGNALDNFITGNSGANIIAGMAGDDIIEGRGGNDVLIGGSGSDRMVGGAGADILFGGEDMLRDTFVLNAASESRTGNAHDTVHDFVSGIDKFDFTGLNESSLIAGSQELVYSGTTVAAHSVWTVQSGANLLLRGDVNGDKAVDFEFLVTDIASLTGSDFIF